MRMKNSDINISATIHQLTNRPFKESRKESLFTELHSLLSAGLDFSHAFKLLIASEENPQKAEIIQQIYDKVVQGYPLWQALEYSTQFSPLDYGVIRIGEETGKLDESLMFLSDYYHKRLEQRRMVSSAISYPLIILCMAVIVVIFMLLVIVPMFEQVYSRMGGELPALTAWIISVSKQFPIYLLIICALTMVFGSMLYLRRNDQKVRSVTANIMLRTPLLGGVLRKNYQAHFCKLLYLLVSSGVPLLNGITMLSDIITFYPYQCSFKNICLGLRRGELFYANLEQYPTLYDRKLITLLRVGEETNRLPEMLRKQGADLTLELEYRLRQLGNMLEPSLILFVGIIVAVILVSMYMPMFKLGGIME